jgi:hypothetical protein
VGYRVAFVLNRTKISSRSITVTVCSRHCRQRHSKTTLSIYFPSFLCYGPKTRPYPDASMSRSSFTSFPSSTLFPLREILFFWRALAHHGSLFVSLCEQALQQRSWLIIKDHRPTDEKTRPFFWVFFPTDSFSNSRK